MLFWIVSENAKPKTARWSVIKDVLHLVDDQQLPGGNLIPAER
jgi:hypothetical protein